MAGKAPPNGSSGGAADWKMPNMASRGWRQATTGRTGKKNRAAYNTYVQRDRLQQFYDRKKVLNKYKRAARFESKNEIAAGGTGCRSSHISNELQMGVESWEEEYERRLSLSYGSGAGSVGTATTRKKRRKGEKASAAAETEATEATEKAPAAVQPEIQLEEEGSAHRSRKRRKLDGRPSAEAPSVTEVPAKADAATEQARPSRDGGGEKAQKKNKKTALPDRFSKDLKEFREKKDAEAKEQQRRRDEESARKKQRTESAKTRAIKGQLVNQRTAWGQPKMQGMLEAITGKLSAEHKQHQPHRQNSGFVPAHRNRR